MFIAQNSVGYRQPLLASYSLTLNSLLINLFVSTALWDVEPIFASAFPEGTIWSPFSYQTNGGDCSDRGSYLDSHSGVLHT